MPVEKKEFSLPLVVKWMLFVFLLLLLMLTAFRLGFYLYFSKQGHGWMEVWGALSMGLRYDLRFISLVILVPLGIGAFPFAHPFRSRKGLTGWMFYLSAVILLTVFFYVVDFVHYAYLSQRLNASVLGYLEDTGISARMVWQSYPVLRLLALVGGLATALILAVRKAHRQISRSAHTASKKMRRGSTALLIIVLAFFVFGRWNQYPLRWSDAYALGSDYQANLALNPFESFFNTLRYRGKTYDPKLVQKNYAFLSAYLGIDSLKSKELNYQRAVTFPPVSRDSQLNVILVICESFSGYKSSMWGNPLNTTPFFDSLSRKGVFFEQCFTPTYGTARGVWAILTGLPDVDLRQTSSRNPAAVDQQLILAQYAGYAKYYFIGGSPSWANIRGLLMNNIPGLKMYEEDNLSSPRLDVWGVSDKNLFLEAAAVLGKSKAPFFAIIQTADNHRPYSIPPEDSDFVQKSPPESLLDANGFKDQVDYSKKLKEYNAFRYTDYTFRQFFEAARRQPYFDHTLFVFVGDHGIAGEAGTPFPPAWTTNRLTTLHVPLLFYAPSRLSPERIGKVVSQIDVMPTIASLCGVSYVNTTLGRDILQLDSSRSFAFTFDPDNAKIGLVKGDHYYRQFLQNGREEIAPIRKGSPELSSTQLAEYRQLTTSFYHTSGYLLTHNPKFFRE